MRTRRGRGWVAARLCLGHGGGRALGFGVREGGNQKRAGLGKDE